MLETYNNRALLVDLYELTMAAAYFEHRIDCRATFELFVRQLPPERGYLVAAGLDSALGYLENLRFSHPEIPVISNIDATPKTTAEGSRQALVLQVTGAVQWAKSMQTLIGLGPGLTPSGDDYLGGVLIALHYFGRRPQAQGLWRWLEPRLARTSAISGAHLAAAAAGEGHEALHRCLEALCSRAADWTAALAALDGVGHCSGWDSLAGVVAVAKIS